MNRVQQEGACMVQLSTGTALWFTRDSFPSVCASVQRADSHYTGPGLYGAQIMFSVQHVVLVVEETPEAQAALAADALVNTK